MLYLDITLHLKGRREDRNENKEGKKEHSMEGGEGVRKTDWTTRKEGREEGMSEGMDEENSLLKKRK